MASAREAISSARIALSFASQSIDDLKHNPGRARNALSNAVITLRTVTFKLQNMAKAEPEFENWYKRKQEDLKKNPLCRYFVEMRNKIEKQASPPYYSSTKLSYLGPETMQQLRPPAHIAPYVVATFFGDQNGGSGWECQFEDGSIERFYFKLPPDIGISELKLIDLPEQLKSRSVISLVQEYYDTMKSLIDDAEFFFVKSL